MCADASIHAYIHCALLMPAFVLQPRWETTERVCDYGQSWTRPGGIGKMSVPSQGFMLCSSRCVAGLLLPFRSYLQLSFLCIKPVFGKYKYWNDTYSSGCMSYRPEEVFPTEPVNNPQQSMLASQSPRYIK